MLLTKSIPDTIFQPFQVFILTLFFCNGYLNKCILTIANIGAHFLELILIIRVVLLLFEQIKHILSI